MTTRLNFGSGSIQPDDWVNVDLPGDWQNLENSELICADIREGFPHHWTEHFDYAVAHCSLQELNHHELGPALEELHRVLKPGGVLRVTVPDIVRGFCAYRDHHEWWFPLGADLPGVDERLCTWLVWFGTVRSVFTPRYLHDLMLRAGFSQAIHLGWGQTRCADHEIVSLDTREHEVFVMEGIK